MEVTQAFQVKPPSASFTLSQCTVPWTVHDAHLPLTGHTENRENRGIPATSESHTSSSVSFIYLGPAWVCQH